MPKLLQNSELVRKVTHFIWIEGYLVSKRLWHPDLKSKVVYKVGSERKRRGLAGLRGGTCRLTPKALPTLIQVHYAVRCPGPCKERDPAETLPRCAQRKPTSSIITRSTCLGHKGGFFLKSQQEKPYILSYLELPYCFIFSVFILKSMSSSTAGWIQSLDMQIMYYLWLILSTNHSRYPHTCFQTRDLHCRMITENVALFILKRWGFKP